VPVQRAIDPVTTGFPIYGMKIVDAAILDIAITPL